MDTRSILGINCLTEKGRATIQKVLGKIKPLAKYVENGEVVPFEALERVVGSMTRKYLIQPQFIMLTYGQNGDVADGAEGRYSCGVKSSDEHEWLGTATGCTMYELFAKLAILMYSQVKTGKVGLRQ